MKNLIIFGTRPEAIKMAPLIKLLKKNKNYKTKVCNTAQHREMTDQVLDFFNIIPDYDIDIMKENQNLFDLTSEIIKNLKIILNDFKPDNVFVHGDTTTSMAASIASFYYGANIFHVEAGLRTNNKLSPFPEEINRQLTARLSDYHFAPTKTSMENLKRENISAKNILVTGNTVIDALLYSLKIVKENPTNFIKNFEIKYKLKEVILVTCHRRENHGKGLENICKALKMISKINKKSLIIFPVHLNPIVQSTVKRFLSNIDNIKLINPLRYQDFIWLMNRSKLILTDSGGVQEEAPSLGKPVIVMRNNTERPEAVNAGTVILAGDNVNLIVNETLDLINNKNRYEKMSKLHNPYGDGKSSQRIVKFLDDLNKKNEE